MLHCIIGTIATYVGYGIGGFAPGRIGENYGRQVNHHVLLAHGEGVQRFRQENLKDAQLGIVVDMGHHHPLRPDSVLDQRAAELENEKAYGSYLNPIFKGEYHPVLLVYMKKKIVCHNEGRRHGTYPCTIGFLWTELL